MEPPASVAQRNRPMLRRLSNFSHRRRTVCRSAQCGASREIRDVPRSGAGVFCFQLLRQALAVPDESPRLLRQSMQFGSGGHFLRCHDLSVLIDNRETKHVEVPSFGDSKGTIDHQFIRAVLLPPMTSGKSSDNPDQKTLARPMRRNRFRQSFLAESCDRSRIPFAGREARVCIGDSVFSTGQVPWSWQLSP